VEIPPLFGFVPYERSSLPTCTARSSIAASSGDSVLELKSPRSGLSRLEYLANTDAQTLASSIKFKNTCPKTGLLL